MAAATKVSDIINTYRPSRQFPAPSGTHYTSIDFDDTGEFLLLSRSDDTIQLFNTKAGAHAKELKSQKYGSALARFTHNSTSIVYASTKVDDGLRYLSMHDNTFIRYFRGHLGRVTSLSMSPGNDNFLSASLDNTVKLWDCRSPSPQGSLDFTAPYLTAFDPSATVIAIASPPCQSLHLYDYRNYDKPPFATFDLIDMEARYASHGQKAGEGWTGMEFSNNGKYILLSTNGPGHYVLDAFSGDLVFYLHRPSGSTHRLAPGDPLEPNDPQKNYYAQSDTTFAPDGQFVIGGNGGQPGLLVWDLRLEKEVGPDKVLEPKWDLPSQRNVAVVAHCPRLNLVASAEKEVLLWVPDQDAA